MKYFQPQEFPEDLKFADPELLLRMDELRGFIKIPIHPSPVPGALARFDAGASDSEHYAVNRKSRAVDFFCEADPFEAFTKILHCIPDCSIGLAFISTLTIKIENG